MEEFFDSGLLEENNTPDLLHLLSLDDEHRLFLVHVLENYSSLLLVRLKKYGEILSDTYSSDLKHQIQLIDDVVKLLGIGFEIKNLNKD